MKWFKQNWLILLILVVSLFLRVYRIGDTMTFLEDEGRDLLIAKRMIDTGRPVLLGPQTSTGNMYLGPLYYYLITPALALSGMNPVGPAILIALSGVLTTYLLFVLGRKWFSPLSGYLAAAMFAILPFSVLVTRASWNPNLVPLITVLMLLVYDRLIYGKATAKLWFAYGALVGVMVQLHYMALIFCGVLTLLILFHFRTKIGSVLKGSLISLAGFLLLISPFIIFELRNDFVNTQAITRFVVAKEDQTLRYKMPLWLWWGKVSQVSYRLVGNTLVGSELGPQPAAAAAVRAYLVIVIIGCLTALIRKEQKYPGLCFLFLACLAILGIYQEYIHLHYVEFALPLVILTFSGLAGRSFPRWLNFLTLTSIVLIMVPGSIRTFKYISSGSNLQAERAKIIADYIAGDSGGHPYNLISSPKTSTSPYQYFAFMSLSPPQNTQTDLVYMICQDQACTDEEIASPLIFIHGPSHPSLAEYTGHPLAAYVVESRNVIYNRHISHGVWVAKIMLE